MLAGCASVIGVDQTLPDSIDPHRTVVKIATLIGGGVVLVGGGLAFYAHQATTAGLVVSGRF